MRQLQQAMGNLWVEAFVSDWMADHTIFGSHRLEENLPLRRKLLRDSLITPNERIAGDKFIAYGDLFLALLVPEHNRVTVSLEDFGRSAWPSTTKD